MLWVNKDIIKRRLRQACEEMRVMVEGLSDMEAAQRVITPTPEQVTAALDAIDDQASSIATAYNSAVEAFTATEPIDPEE
jgi:hypothetical protein